MPSTPDPIAAFVADLLDEDDQPVLVRRGDRPIRSLGLALDFDSAWAAPALDALFLHRSFGLPPEALSGVTILTSHAGFDRRLTTGHNVRLAEALGLCDVRRLDLSGGAEGMVGDLPAPLAWAGWEERLASLFGGLEAAQANGTARIRRVVVANAMREATVREAFHLGAQSYVTGQMRLPGREAARALGLGIVAIGHRRSELWGLARLAEAIQAAFPDVRAEVLTPQHGFEASRPGPGPDDPADQ